MSAGSASRPTRGRPRQYSDEERRERATEYQRAYYAANKARHLNTILSGIQPIRPAEARHSELKRRAIERESERLS